MRTFVLRGLIVASGLIVGGTAAAQGTYGTPSLLPPANNSTYGPSGSVLRTNSPRTYASEPVRATQPVNYRTQDLPGFESPSDVPTGSPSVLAEPVRPGPTQPSPSYAPQYAPQYDSGGYAPGIVGNGLGAGGLGGGVSGGCVTPSYVGAGSGYGSGSSYAGAGSGCDLGAPPVSANGWYVGVGGLIFTRDNENPYLFSYDDANEARQLTDTRDASMSYSGGYEAWIGYYFNCGQSAIEVGYWELLPNAAVTTTTAAQVTGNLNGILNWDQITYNGNPGNVYVNNAQAHQVVRDWNIQNLELNFLQLVGTNSFGPCGGPFTWSLLGGVRYFRFEELMQFGADTVDGQFTGAVDELYYRVATDNNLVGFQVGGNGRYCLTQRLALTSGLKLGIYNNHINHQSVIYGAAGTATVNNGPYAGQAWNVNSSKDDIAFLGELNLGLSYQLGSRWSIYGGYRALALTGVALPTNQIYHDLRGLNDVSIVDSNGSLILHGAYAGLTFCF